MKDVVKDKAIMKEEIIAKDEYIKFARWIRENFMSSSTKDDKWWHTRDKEDFKLYTTTEVYERYKSTERLRK